MKFLEILRRYAMINLRMLNFKVILVLSFGIPFLIGLLLLFINANPLETTLYYAQISKNNLVGNLEKVGFTDYLASYYFYFIKLAYSITDSKDGTGNWIFGFMLSGIFLSLLINHIIWICFEFSIYLTKKDKNNTMSDEEIEAFVYWKIFKKNINEKNIIE